VWYEKYVNYHDVQKLYIKIYIYIVNIYKNIYKKIYITVIINSDYNI